MAGRYILELSTNAFKQNFRNLLEDLEALSAAAVLLAGRSGGQTVRGGTAASEVLELRGTANATPGTVRVEASSFVFNEAGADLDFRLEGDNQANLFFLDASADSVGLRTASPLTVLHVFHASTTPAGELGSLLVTGASSAERLAMGYATGTGAWIQSTLSGVGQTLLRLNPSGGGVQLSGDVNVMTGHLTIEAVGKGLKIKEGSNARMGVATLVAGTVTVNNTSVTASTRIFCLPQDNNTTGALRISARTAGTSFNITSSNAGDTGVIAWLLIEPS